MSFRPREPALRERPRSGLQRVTAAGAELRYLRTGAGKPLVLLHTLRTQLEYFRALLERLELRRLDVVAVDLPGHGHSTAPPVEYTADYFSDSIEQLLEACELTDALVAGDSIGGTIALTIAARRNRRVSHVIAVNPYDYGRWGGIRRSSALANVSFTALLWPGVGPVVARATTPGILRRVMEGGLYDPSRLPAALVEEMYRCGKLPGHARAFRSLNKQWRTWVAARARYPEIELPVTLAYGSADWSRLPERKANAGIIPGVRLVSLERCGHFASLEKPDAIARLIDDAG